MERKSPFSRIHHIGVVVRDIDKTIDYLSSLGIGPFEPPHAEPPVTEKLVRGKPVDYSLKMSNAKMEGVNIELLQPVKGESVQKEFLESRGEGIQHIGFAVDDRDSLDSEVARLVKKGVKILSSIKRPGGGNAYLDTGVVGGVVIELMIMPPPMKK